MLQILIDRNVEREAVTHRTTIVPRKVVWSTEDLSSSVTLDSYALHREKKSLPEDQSNRSEQWPYIAALGKCAREGKIELFTSRALQDERTRQKPDTPDWLDVSLLGKAPRKDVGLPPNLTVSGLVPTLPIFPTSKDHDDFFRLIDNPRFLQIAERLGHAHIDDAFHLWTAESFSLDIFLTMERRFTNVVTQHKAKLAISVRVMSPSEVCSELGLNGEDIDATAKELGLTTQFSS